MKVRKIFTNKKFSGFIWHILFAGVFIALSLLFIEYTQGVTWYLISSTLRIIFGTNSKVLLDISSIYSNIVNIYRIEKYQADKVWTCVLFDADNQGYPYIKRFQMEATKRKQNYLGENPQSMQVLLTDVVYPLIKVTYGGPDAFRNAEEIDAEQFIGVKGFKAKGKRISTYQIESIVELEPVRFPEEPEEPEEPETMETTEEPNLDPDTDKVTIEQEQSEYNRSAKHEQARTKSKSQQQIIDEMTGQLRLFDDEV